MENFDTFAIKNDYSKLSLIGEYSTLLLIADGSLSYNNNDMLVSIMFYESLLIYLIFWIVCVRKNEKFLNYFFERLIKPSHSKPALIRDIVIIILFTVSFVIPSALWPFFQYTIVLSSILVLIAGIVHRNNYTVI